MDNPIRAIGELNAFIRGRQLELGLGQNELARACGLSQGTLANLLGGRVTRAPSLHTIERLAKGLREDPATLMKIMMAQVEPTDARPEGEVGPSAAGAELAPAGSLSDTANSLTDEEWSVLRRAQEAGLYWHCQVDAELLALSPGARRHLFMQLDCLVHSIALHKRSARIPE